MTLLTVILGAFLQLIPQPAHVETLPGFCDPDYATVGKEIAEAPDLPDSDEGYVLVITPGDIRMRARSEAGIFYAEQTLAAIRRQFQGRVPAMKIIDYPRFEYRGAHIDVSRHFFDKEVIKRQLRTFASLKLNRFHWHLTDGAAWRLQIDRYPKLTEGVEHYTREDVREVLALADSLHITVIPEIEMFGHSEEVLEVYPELRCKGDAGCSNVYCIGKEKTFRFLENVLDEVIELFPSEYIHIGGDEADMEVWARCPECRRRMHRECLSGVEQLQSYGIARIEKFVNSRGRRIIGWDEILEGGLAENAVVMSWRGEEGGRTAAGMGHNVIMTPGEYCYLDGYQDTKSSEPVAMGNYVPLAKVYSYDPAPESMPGREFVLGVQTNLWTEWIETPPHLEYMLYPRVMALAEIAWSPVESRDYADFRKRALSACRELREEGYNTFDLETEAGERPEYSDTLHHKAFGCKVSYQTEYSESYDGGGVDALTDGLQGPWHFKTRWQGFLNTDAVYTVDLGEIADFCEVKSCFTQWYTAWICMPVEVSFEASLDGKDFFPLGSELNAIDPKNPRPLFHTFSWNGKAKARYVRVTARINDDKWGWLFTDELIIN